MNNASHSEINTLRTRTHKNAAFNAFLNFLFPRVSFSLTILRAPLLESHNLCHTHDHKMAPPLTGFIMKAVGLGDAHKQIEAEKRARDDAADRRDFNRRMKHSMYPVHYSSFACNMEWKANKMDY